LSEKTDRERESSSVWNTEKSELALEIKSVSTRYESELKNLQLYLEEEKEKSGDLESRLQERENSNTELQRRMQDIEESLQS
jgi:hypothetical protein